MFLVLSLIGSNDSTKLGEKKLKTIAYNELRGNDECAARLRIIALPMILFLTVSFKDVTIIILA